jgi:uncharacterized membrane protein
VREFSARTHVDRPPADVFDFIADYRNVPRVLEGVSRWEPLGRRTRGAGARYNVEMRTLGVPLSAVLKLSEWRRPERIAWVSEEGLIPQRGGWTFTPRGSGVDLELKMAYEPPAAALGNFIAGRVERLVRRRLERALARIRAELEGRTAGTS